MHIDTLFKQLLLPIPAPHFEQIYAWALRIEFQGRGTEHIHLAMWARRRKGQAVVGRTGEPHASLVVPILERMFGARVDSQLGSG